MKNHSNTFKSLNLLDDSRLKSIEIRHPFVTIIVTNYNYDKYIIPCLKSVASQTYDHYKCIVVDDCSTDKSVELIEDFIKNNNLNGKFSLIRHDKNLGQMAAFKTGLKYAEGTFVVFLDSDDLLLEDFLITHIRAHMDKTVAFTSSNQCQISEHSEILAGTHDALQEEWRYTYLNPRHLYDPFWLWATTSSMMFRRSVLELIITDECGNFRTCADTYICHFAHLIGGSLLIPTIHGCYRRHGLNNFSGNPVISRLLHIGDMNKHPKHSLIRSSIIKHFFKNHEKFSPFFTEDKYILTIIRLAKPFEIIRIRKRYHYYFKSKTRLFTVKLLALSIISRTKYLIKKYCWLFKVV